MLAISKCDIVPYDNLEKIKNKLPNDLPVVFLSSQIHMGVDEIKDTLWNLLNTNN